MFYSFLNHFGDLWALGVKVLSVTDLAHQLSFLFRADSVPTQCVAPPIFLVLSLLVEGYVCYFAQFCSLGLWPSLGTPDFRSLIGLLLLPVGFQGEIR